jgi:alkaline phosphatase D
MPKFSFETLLQRIASESERRFILALTRRDFLKTLSAGMAAALTIRSLPDYPARATATASTAYADTMPNGVASGDTTQTSTVLWTRSTARGTVTFEVFAADVIHSTHTAEVTDETIPVKVFVDGLVPDTEYTYRVTDAAGNTLTGRFHTPAELGTNPALRFGVSGDWRGELRPYVVLSNVAQRNLDFFMLHGDTIYADVPSRDFNARQARTLTEFRIKHNEVTSPYLNLNFWAEVRASTSVFATIDDHELTNDFAGGAHPQSNRFTAPYPEPMINQTVMYNAAMQAFHEYNPMRVETYTGTNDPRMEGRPKLYRYTTYGSTAAVIVLDARSFRDVQIPGIDSLDLAALDTFTNALFTPGRTMLGRAQVEALKRDLLAAHEAGIRWKFVMMPEPVQQMGWFNGEDRWEGYAPERTEVLQFIEDRGIRNVVFVAADVHSTFVNNLTYQLEPTGELFSTHAWEISTGPIAYYPPTGAAIIENAANFGLVSQSALDSYRQMSIPEKDELMRDLFNFYVLRLQGLQEIGLDGEIVKAELLQGAYASGHTFGWTEFDIEAETGILTVTVYGVPPYDRAMINRNPDSILNAVPEIISQFRVTPQTT